MPRAPHNVHAARHYHFNLFKRQTFRVGHNLLTEIAYAKFMDVSSVAQTECDYLDGRLREVASNASVVEASVSCVCAGHVCFGSIAERTRASLLS